MRKPKLDLWTAKHYSTRFRSRCRGMSPMARCQGAFELARSSRG